MGVGMFRRHYPAQPQSLEPSDVARWMASRRQRKAKACEVCGKVFEALAGARYCSSACRSRAYYARHRGEILARVRERRARR